MRALTLMQAAWRADTQRGESLAFENCKGGLFSTDPAFALKVEGKTDGDSLVKAGSTVSCRGKNLWPHGDVHFQGYKTGHTISLPAGTYSFSARIFSEDTDSTRSLVIVTCGESTTAVPVPRQEGRSGFSFTIPGGSTNFSLYASSTLSNSTNGGRDAASFEDIMVEEGSTRTDYAPYSYSEITLPCDLHANDAWFPALGKVTRSDGSDETYPVQNLTAATGKCFVCQEFLDLPADLTATMLVRR